MFELEGEAGGGALLRVGPAMVSTAGWVSRSGYILLAGLISGLLGGSSLHAQDVASEISGRFTGLGAIRLEYRDDIEYFEQYIVNLQLDPRNAKITCTTTIDAKGGLWRYSANLRHSDGEIYRGFTVVHGPESSSYLDETTGLMRTSKVERRWIAFDNLNPLQILFPFINAKSDVGTRSLLIQDLENKALWTEAFANAQSLPDINVGSLDCFSFKFKGGNDLETGDPVWYVASFPKTATGLWPVRVETVDARGNVLQQVSAVGAERTDAKAKSVFPSQVTVVRMDALGRKLYQQRLQMVKCETNKEIDESEFMVDPSTADTIEDWDNHVTIDVPR